MTTALHGGPTPRTPSRCHLDIHIRHLDSAHRLVVEGGAMLLADSGSHRVYSDPIGHPFCLYPGDADGLWRVVIDCPDAELSAFYAELLGRRPRTTAGVPRGLAIHGRGGRTRRSPRRCTSTSRSTTARRCSTGSSASVPFAYHLRAEADPSTQTRPGTRFAAPRSFPWVPERGMSERTPLPV